MGLSIAHPPKGSTTASTLDIVALHGLGGDSIKTWTHPKSGAFWLKDFLPQQIPDARIMTFGYNAAVAFGQSTSGVIDHAKGLLSSLMDKREESEEKGRPLIFIAHSLGGIVVKQALLQARLEPRYQSIRDATLGIIFLGTPHRGSEKATYGKVLANVAQTMVHGPSPHLLSALQTNSDILQRLTSDFRFQLPQYHVVSFYEQQPMKIFQSLIVEKQSALLEVEHEEQIPVDANHSAMCKFETADDDTFGKVYKRIRRMRNTPRPRAINPADSGQWELKLREQGQRRGLRWSESVVDLLKLLELESSRDARRLLAKSLGVFVAADGTAAQNEALRIAIMRELEENNGEISKMLVENAGQISA